MRKCFQPDCARFKDNNYIAVPTIINQDEDTLRVYIFQYDNSRNTCTEKWYVDIEGVKNIRISGVYLSTFKQDSVNIPEFVVVNSSNEAFYVTAYVNETVQWSSRAVSQILGETTFKRIVRSGINQLVGFDANQSFVYDFQSRVKYNLSAGFISNVYATDFDATAAATRNYMLVQHAEARGTRIYTRIYSVEPTQ